MLFLNYFNFKTLKYDLINKFYYNKTKNLPKLKKIILNFGCKTTKIKNLSSSLLALELISDKKGKLTLMRHPNIALKVRKENPVGCKVILKDERIFNLLERLICEVIPRIKGNKKASFRSNLTENSFYLEIKDIFSFKELEKNYYLFNELNKLDIIIVFESELKKEFNFVITSLKLVSNDKISVLHL